MPGSLLLPLFKALAWIFARVGTAAGVLTLFAIDKHQRWRRGRLMAWDGDWKSD
jgi:hypothetical protein